jgi:hypothetical protein
LHIQNNRVGFLRINSRRRKVSMKERFVDAIAEIGGETLDGSGFENERPEAGFSGAVLPPSTFVRESPRGSQ